MKSAASTSSAAISIRRAPIRAISSSSKSCSPASLPAPLSTTFNIGGVSFHPASTGVRVAYAEGYAAFFIAAPDPQLSVVTPCPLVADNRFMIEALGRELGLLERERGERGLTPWLARHLAGINARQLHLDFRLRGTPTGLGPTDRRLEDPPRCVRSHP